MKKLLLLLLLLPLWLHAQAVPTFNVTGTLRAGSIASTAATLGPGRISGAAIETNGWELLLYFDSMPTNQTFTLGWATNNPITGSEKVTVTLTSQGYGDDGSTTTKSRTVYGTKQVRFPYPANAYADTEIVDSSCRVKVALSEYVYAGDSNISLSIASSVYGTNDHGSGYVVTNLSTELYPPAIANWSWPGYRIITNDILDLGVLAFHQSAEQARPVRAVRFWVTDEHSNTAESWVTAMTLTTNRDDAVPFAEYVASIDVSTLTDGDKLVCNFAAFPWVGDTNAVIDSSKLSYSQPTANPAPLTNVLHSASTYGFVRAIVDSSTGNDSTGVAASETYWATNSSPAAFLTIGGALSSIGATNNAVYGHADIGGGIVLLNAGNYNWLGASVSIATKQAAECIVMPASGVSRSSVVITNYATDNRVKDDDDIFRIYNITYNTDTTAIHSRFHQLWMDQCDVTSPAAGFVSGSTSLNSVWHLTGCTLRAMTQGLRYVSGQRVAVGIVRGNTWDGMSASAMPYVLAGNLKTTNTSAYSTFLRGDWAYSATTPEPIWNGIWYNNIFNSLRYAGAITQIGDNWDITNGFAIIQNVFEGCTNDAAAPYFGWATKDIPPDLYHYTNVLVWNNTLLGQKNLMAYNDTGTNAYWRVKFSLMNNIYDDFNIKADLLAPESGNRVGNWSLLYGVGCYGEAGLETANIGAPGDFLREFPGIYSWENADGNSATNYAQFTDRQANDGVAAASLGGGTYSLSVTSPLYTRQRTKYILPYDLGGAARSANDPPGAYQ